MGAAQLTLQKVQAFIPFSAHLLRDSGPLPGDEEEYAKRVKPCRGGILSLRRLHDKRTTRGRLLRDAEAMRDALRETVEDLVDSKSWGEHLAQENSRLRARIDEVFSYLTQEERERIWKRSAEVRVPQV